MAHSEANALMASPLLPVYARNAQKHFPFVRWLLVLWLALAPRVNPKSYSSVTFCHLQVSQSFLPSTRMRRERKVATVAIDMHRGKNPGRRRCEKITSTLTLRLRHTASGYWRLPALFTIFFSCLTHKLIVFNIVFCLVRRAHCMFEFRMHTNKSNGDTER